MSYKVKLDTFEGPLDLLLYLIKKNEVDIYNIPIAAITEQYLEYLELMKALNLDIAGEFLVMASTLMYIKSKMLLPISQDLDEGEIEEDPRAELVERLLEYRRFKEAAQWLENQNLLGRDTFARSLLIMDIEAGDKGDDSIAVEDVSIIELLEAFRGVLARSSKEEAFEISITRLSIADRIQEILDILNKNASIEFLSFFTPSSDRPLLVLTFLAILELVKLSMIKAYQTKPFGKILLRLKEENEKDRA